MQLKLRTVIFAGVMIAGTLAGFAGTLVLLGHEAKHTAPVVAFDGKTASENSLQAVGSFTADMWLKSAPTPLANQTEQNYPETPLRIGDMVLSRWDDDYTFWAGVSRTIWRGGEPSKWNRLTIVGDSQARTIRVFLNGKRVAESKWVKGWDRDTFVWLGRSTVYRFWRGEIRNFRFFGGAMYKNDFDPEELRLAANAPVLVETEIARTNMKTY